MRYKELIEKISVYGYGVFTLTMVQDETERASLTKFVQRNPQYFTEYRGTKGYLKLIVLSNTGKIYFNLKCRLTTSTTWQSLLDIALFNAYMAEKNQWEILSNKPYSILKLGDEKVGLISSRWGITKNFDEVNLLLATEAQKELLLNNLDFIQKSAKELRATERKVMELISNSYTPKAFLHLRKR